MTQPLSVTFKQERKENQMTTLVTDSQHSVLTIPEPKFYVPRVIAGQTEQEIYDFARNTGHSVIISGDAGTGKTSSAYNYAATNQLPYVAIQCTQQIDQTVTQGRFVPTGHGNELAWKYSRLATIIQGPGVVLLNEFSRMNPKAAPLFLGLLQERQLVIEPLNEVIKVHDNCLIIADQNVDYRATVQQDEALLDRFVKIEFEYDRKIEEQFIDSAALLDFAESIREARKISDQFTATVTTRMLIHFQTFARGLSFKFAVYSLLNNFSEEDGEREAIQQRFDINRDRIASELGVELGDYTK